MSKTRQRWVSVEAQERSEADSGGSGVTAYRSMQVKPAKEEAASSVD